MGGLLLAAFSALAAVLLVPLIVVGAIGPSLWLIMQPKFTNTQKKAVLAEITRPYVLPKDSTITPLEAGRAFYALAEGGSRRSLPFEHPAPPWTNPPWDEPMPEGLFPTARPVAYQGPDPTRILAAAARGFTRAETAYLERFVRWPMWREFRTVARAPAMDYLGARFAIPFPPGLSPYGIPIPLFAGTKALAYAATAKAAYYLSRGRRDSAETALRETISFGFALHDNASNLMESLIGVVMVGIGRSGLIQYYAIAGNPAGARLKARFDSVLVALEDPTGLRVEGADDRPAANPLEAREMLVTSAANPRAIRSLRWESVLILASAPCTNLQELVFGPAPDARAAFERARTELARYPSEGALLDMIVTSPERTGFQYNVGVGRRALGVAAALAGKVLHNRWLPGCAASLTLLSTIQ